CGGVGREASPGHRFSVYQLRKGRVDDSVALRSQPKAEINVVVGDCQVFVESAESLEHSTANHHACAGYGGAVSDNLGLIEISRSVAWAEAEQVPGDPTSEAHNDTGVLHRPVGIEQP